MLASLLNIFSSWDYLQTLLTSPVFWVVTAFQLWMLVHVVRNQEWL